MEIKIKDQDQLIDATIEVVDGVMIVSPKEEKYEPKDGDIVFSGSSLISIFKEFSSGTSFASYASLSNEEFKKGFDFWSASNIRPATEEEKQKLFDKLKEEGLEWNADKKELVKLKWKPICGHTVFIPNFKKGIFITLAVVWVSNELDSMLQKCMVFNTQEECQVFCDKLNKAIEGVKP